MKLQNSNYLSALQIQDQFLNQRSASVEKQLKKDGFFMPHRSCLLNFQWVQSFTNDEIVMKNGDKLSLSRRKYREWKIAYFEWKFDRANG